MGGYRECDHVAPVYGVRHVFASVEWPEAEPPDEMRIAGLTYRRVAEAAREPRTVDANVGHHLCSLCHATVGAADAWCRRCGARLS